MSRLDECIAATAAELGLASRDVREIADRIGKYRKKQLAEGRLDRLEEEVRGFAQSEAEKVRLAAALKRKQAALVVILRSEWEQDLAKLRGLGLSPLEAILAKLVGSYAGVANARKSAAARRIALEGDWLGGLTRELPPEAVALLKRPREAKPLLDDIVREWRELRDGGSPGRTGNKDAQKLAGILAKYAEASRLEANRAGANIGRIDGWGGPQSHDEAKLLAAGQQAWVDATLPLLDLERSFGEHADAEEARRILGDVWDNIVTGRGQQPSAKETGQRVGPASLARSLEKHRVLHFKDADAWIAYNDRFGRGNVITAMVDHLHRMARTVANMQVMGPNPEAFVDAILEAERARLRALGGSAATVKALQQLEADLRKGTGAIGRAFVEVMGDTYRPANLTAAKIGAGVRAVQSMAKLGGALVSSVTDLVTYAHAMRFQGKGLLQSYAEAFDALLGGRPAKERREIALSLSVGFDNLLGDIHARFAADDNLPGAVNGAMRTFFKLNGLTWWTDRLTHAFASMSSNWMARQAGRSWEGLSEAYRHVLSLHGITAERWELIRAHAVETVGDHAYVLPEKLRDLADEAMPERARRELELDLRSFFADEASFAVLQTDDRTRTITTLGTQPGTPLGEAWRFIMQLKSFPIAYTQKILAPAFRGRGPGGQRDYGALAALIGMSWVLGYAAMATKDILKNRTPRDPLSKEALLAALLQGGGAGIYGDFLFGASNRFGSGVLETAAGPAIGTASDAIELWQKIVHGDAKAGDAYWLALNNAPFANLHLLRPAADLLILNQVAEWVSPGSSRRREQKLKRENDQRHLIDPLALWR